MKRQMRLAMVVVLLLSCISPLFASASGTPESDTVTVSVNLTSTPNLKRTYAVFNLYSEDSVLLATDSFIVSDQNDVYQLHFQVPRYQAGAKFRLELLEGLHSFKSYDTLVYPHGNTILETYAVLDVNTGTATVANHFAISGNPITERPMDLYVNGKKFALQFPLKMVDRFALAEIGDLTRALGLKNSTLTFDDPNGTFTLTYQNKALTFSYHTNVVLQNGEQLINETPAYRIEGSAYVPIKLMALIYAKDYRLVDSGYAADAIIDLYPKPYAESDEKAAALMQKVNRDGVSSKTPYLIWISKKDYRVNVFEGAKGNWTLLKSIPCAIGTDQTPTITGQYEYFSLESKWYYPDYYVGPIMRFYNGYAIHSTLLRYDGSDYDPRVGIKLSHGCIRVSKEDINWLVYYIPKQTKIYITE